MPRQVPETRIGVVSTRQGKIDYSICLRSDGSKPERQSEARLIFFAALKVQSVAANAFEAGRWFEGS